ncbi:MAG: PilZ domain-containing protein [Desulfohalobiaceae bacterium]|nr:PilZ domain-containing protein [Desulfohalobiaceae bacterium]
MESNRKTTIDLNGLEVEISSDNRTLKSWGEEEATLRRSFRVPVDQDDRVQLKIQSEPFQISNVSEGGLQVLLQQDDLFFTGQILDPVDIFFPETSLRLKGKVTYVDQIDVDRYALGLELIF